MLKTVMLRSSLIALACALSVTAHAYAADPKRVDVPAGDLTAALETLAKQSGVELVYQTDQLKGLRTQGVTGNFSPEEAVTKLLEGTKLTLKTDTSGAMLIALPRASSNPETPEPGSHSSRTPPVPQADEGTPLSLQGRGAGGEGTPSTGEEKKSFWSRFRLAQAETSSRSEEENKNPSSRDNEKKVIELEEVTVGIPEILVTGSKTLNMDIRRSRDDVQPYVVFEQMALERSGATNLEDFLKQRLPMNSVGRVDSQFGSTNGAISNINLRGLGTNQTLILVDGHRISSGFAFGSAPSQPDTNGIPLAAIERIEVLPTTASAIYGGGATGGVINIVRRRNYQGGEVKATYDNAFGSDAGSTRLDFSAGFGLESGRTQVMLAGSYFDANPLTIGERDFTREGRARILRNNPAFYQTANNPPLGATPNIRSVDGSPLFGPGTPSYTSVPVGYAGGGGLAPLQTNAGTYNFDLAGSSQSDGLQRSILNNPTVKSGMVTVRREFSPRVDAFVDFVASENAGSFRSSAVAGGSFTLPAAAPTNPFGKDVRVTVPNASVDQLVSTEFTDKRAVAGLVARLGTSWQAEVDYTWDRYTTQWTAASSLNGTQTAALANGTLDLLRDTQAFPIDFAPYITEPVRLLTPQRATLKDATLRVAGPVGKLPGGSMTLTTILGHREELLSDTLQFINPSLLIYYPSRSQSVDSAYGELRLPLLAPGNDVFGAHALEAQVAVRSDRYTINGADGFTFSPTDPITRVTNHTSSTNPTIGLRYQPAKDVTLRTSYGTGFLPPNVTQLIAAPPNTNSGANFVDPRRGNTAVPTHQFIGGGSADLEPEKSKSWSVGVVLTPRLVTGLRVSVDYSRVRKTDNILGLQPQQIIDNESLLAGRITRGPNLPGDLPGWAGPITAINGSAVNVAKSNVEAFDLALDYGWETAAAGRFDLFLAGTRQTHFETQLAPTTPIVENVGISFQNPLKWKANAGLSWSYRSWQAAWTTRYFDSYFVADPSLPSSAAVIANQGSARVSSQTYHDVFASYELSSLPGGMTWATLELQGGMRNLFNHQPPFDAAFTTTAQYLYSPFGDPRLRSYYVALKMVF